jgi:hypothetical protein
MREYNPHYHERMTISRLFHSILILLFSIKTIHVPNGISIPHTKCNLRVIILMVTKHKFSGYCIFKEKEKVFYTF